MSKDKRSDKEKLRKTAKGVYIAASVVLFLVGLVFFAVISFIGVKLWQWLAPLFKM